MAALFTLTDGTVIPDVTLYSEITDPQRLAQIGRDEPVYTVFHHEGLHCYVPVARVRRIDAQPSGRNPQWWDLPIAAGMWAADGADLGA